ncbi:MAG: response regulator, partial [Phycisphaerae bacterium]
VVEDDPHILRVICFWLKRQGHEIIEARNGLAGFEQFEKHTPEILVTDLNMPGMTGLELIEKLKPRPDYPRGVIVLTNRWDHREIGEQLATSGVLVMPKPFSPSALAERVNEIANGGAAATAEASKQA